MSLASRERSAVLELFALQSRLARADKRVAELRARAAEVAAERAAAEDRLALVRSNLVDAQKALGDRLRTLYVEGNPDPLAVLLGATSLDEALTTLDSLGRLARNDRQIVDDVLAARRDVKRAIASLDREQARLAAVTADAESARDALAAATTERRSYIASVRREQSLNRSEIGDLTSAAQAAEDKAEEIAAAPAPTPTSSPTSSPPPPPPPPQPTSTPPSAHTLTVVATGYSLRGTTSTGVPVGWGVVAVDPSVIALGTRMTIPGYGEGVAADTGSAVRGATIDLWFPTRAQALAWGRRTITISLH
ncbi:MAG TPA: 3D domain-containing protein [Gaiellaceae bacterium]